MSDEPDLERFRAGLRALGERASPREDCPTPERLWACLRAELPVEERRVVVDHVAGCLSCADAWRLGAEIDPDPRPTAAAARPGRAALAEARVLLPLAAVLILALGTGLVLLRAPERPPDLGYRDAERAPIRSLSPEEQPLPRTAFLLQWSPGPGGSRYDVRVTTESLEEVAFAQGLHEASFLVPETALASLPGGTRLLWQVQMRLPDGERRDSPTFITPVR